MPTHSNKQPSAWVVQWAKAIPATGSILDLACGSGRHLQHLAQRGQPVVGIDVDISAAVDLERQPNIALHQRDLEQPDAALSDLLPDADYAGIVVTNYLHRPLLNSLPNHLAAGGILIYETFALGNEKYGRPRNSHFLLRPDELLDAYSGRLNILGFEQGFTATPYPAVMQRICAEKVASG
jgi:SAM-dependent methyltransferase